MKISIKTLFLSFVALSILSSCDNPPQMPKPSTYLRIELAKPHYVPFSDTDYPFSFSYPDYARIEKLDSQTPNVQWFNIHFPQYNFVTNVSVIHLTSPSSLQASINDCYTFLKRHEKVSGGIIEQDFSNPQKHVYGTAFTIKGTDVVSPYQFYLTDSNTYFVRFALNSNAVPNNDSCSVVIDQLKKDLNHLISSFEWRK